MRGYYHDLNTRYHPSQPTPELHSPHCPNKATLLGIPTETRNAIYGLVLDTDDAKLGASVKFDKCELFPGMYRPSESRRQKDNFAYPEGSISIRYTHPMIQVCTQMREEAYQMFLAANDFVAVVKEEGNTHDPATDSGYGYLLDILARLGPGHVRTIKSISLVCDDSCFDFETKRVLQYGFVDMWDKFLPKLLAQGIQVDQLRWPGVCIPKHILESDEDSWEVPDEEEQHESAQQSREAVVQNLQQMAAFYKCIIQPALWTHGCISLDWPVPDMMQQIRSADVLSSVVDDMTSPLSSYRLSKIFEEFNRAYYEREQDLERKEHWRKQGLYWSETLDANEDYRAKYPSRWYTG